MHSALSAKPQPTAANHLPDELLRPFLQAADETAAEHALADLLAGHAAPLIRTVVRAKLRAFHLDAAAGTPANDFEDVCSEAMLQLLRQLRQHRTAPPHAPIGNFRSYVAVTAYHVCYEHLREKYPRRHGVKDKLRYLLTHHHEFALWEAGGEQLCGMAAWRDRPPVRPTPPRLVRLQDEPEAFARAALADRDVARLPPAELAAAIFRWVEAPVELDTLVGVVARLWGVTDRPVAPAGDEAAGDFEQQLADSRPGVAAQTEQRFYLQRLWQEINQLPPRQRAALLLNLRDQHGTDILALLPATGIASLRQLAATLEMTAEVFAAVWNDLPLDDARIAAQIGITRQQMINLRKSARERLARRMSAFA